MHQTTLTPEFIQAFLTTCFEAGLSKEAAATLLQKESADQACAASPEFAEGYRGVMDAAGGPPPIEIRDYLEIEKAAAGNLMRAGKGLWDLVAGIGGAFGAGGRSAAKGVQTVARSNFLKTHPFASALTAAGVAGTGGYAINQLANREKQLSPYGADPFFAPGGYSPEQYRENYDNQLYKGYGPGIYEHNKAYFGTEDRRKELEDALREGRGGGGTYRELTELNRQHAAAGRARKDYLAGLDAQEAAGKDLLGRISRRQSQLESQRTSLWGAPKRMWLSMTGRDPKEYFDDQIARLHSNAAQAKMQTTLADDRRRLVASGATHAPTTTTTPTSSQLQERFFPAFK